MLSIFGLHPHPAPPPARSAPPPRRSRTKSALRFLSRNHRVTGRARCPDWCGRGWPHPRTVWSILGLSATYAGEPLGNPLATPWRMRLSPLADAAQPLGGCGSAPWRMRLRVGADAAQCRGGCGSVSGRMRLSVGADAAQCRGGCGSGSGRNVCQTTPPAPPEGGNPRLRGGLPAPLNWLCALNALGGCVGGCTLVNYCPSPITIRGVKL